MVDRKEFVRLLKEYPEITETQVASYLKISRQRANQLHKEYKTKGESEFLKVNSTGGRPVKLVQLNKPMSGDMPLTLDNIDQWLKQQLEESRKVLLLKEKKARLQESINLVDSELAIVEARLRKVVETAKTATIEKHFNLTEHIDCVPFLFSSPLNIIPCQNYDLRITDNIMSTPYFNQWSISEVPLTNRTCVTKNCTNDIPINSNAFGLN